MIETGPVGLVSLVAICGRHCERNRRKQTLACYDFA